MANCLCQLGWAVVPRYVVIHHSGCFSECVLSEINI